MLNKKIISILGTVFICVGILGGCGNSQINSTSSKSENSKTQDIKYSGKEGQISVYLSGPDAMVKKLETTFEKERGDVLNIYRTGCGPLRQKVWTEMEAGQIQADVVWGSDPLMYIALKDKDKLEKYKTTNFNELKDDYKTVGDDYYTLVNVRYGTILYNKANVESSKVPKSFEELKEKQWNGRVCIADATQSSTALALTSGLCQINDKGSKELDYMKALKSNNILLVKQNGTVASKVDQGEVDVAIAPHDEALRIIKKAKKEGTKSDLAISWPNDGVLRMERPIAIIKNEARPEKKYKDL